MEAPVACHFSCFSSEYCIGEGGEEKGGEGAGAGNGSGWNRLGASFIPDELAPIRRGRSLGKTAVPYRSSGGWGVG